MESATEEKQVAYPPIYDRDPTPVARSNQADPTTPHGQLAQSVEQRTFNPLVLGSSPRLPTSHEECSRGPRGTRQDGLRLPKGHKGLKGHKGPEMGLAISPGPSVSGHLSRPFRAPFIVRSLTRVIGRTNSLSPGLSYRSPLVLSSMLATRNCVISSTSTRRPMPISSASDSARAAPA